MARISPTDCVLLHANGFDGTNFPWNSTTALALTNQGCSIGATLSCPERPLLPTILFVECHGVDFINEPPRIIRAVEDTILFSVLIGPRPVVSPCKYEYFIYRVGDVPTLQLLPPPLDNFIDEDAGLLLHGESEFMVASLVSTRKFDFYELHRFDSRTGVWSQVVVRLVEPQMSFPFRITRNSSRLGYHLTSAVITIGGEGGRMGWVDLWRGILICDVLDSEPELRGVPLPLPMDLLTCNNGRGAEIGGYANPIRGIAVVGQCLRFVHLEAIISTASRTTLPTYSSDSDEETETFPDRVMSDWVIHTWSNSKMTASWEDWIVDCKARASHATIPRKVMSKMLNSGLLSPEGANPVRALGNLWVSHPAPGTDDGVVYLLARLKFEDPKAFIIALDTRENTLLGSANFATEKKRGAGIMYFPSNISKYIDPEDRSFPISKGVEDNYEESSLNEGTESVEFPFEKIIYSGLKCCW
ncbi:hypothetical protein PAHAL_2G225200 [Panicum hallii]|uniref:DUF1618 domain-containing protein n=1 Tax=Panicum hallii TaxID=206008 RepID=A0A2S3GZ75_9POAL|nr:uncharacterized protein LOC112879296 [Panicum hallii]PAN11879.1 hypothetical protein PAHAL_2G225200 [Panicum hallii]